MENNVQNPNTAWSCPKFVEFMKYSPKMAYDYRAKCGMGEVPDEYKDVVVVVEAKEVVLEADTAIEPTIEQMKEILTSNGIKFSHLIGEKKLKELCLANNLM